MASQPTVLISSTFYDLSQVRTNLREFLQDEMGYTPLAFEEGTFPIDTDVDTIENCRRRVARDTDILVLVVGNRYGSIDTITNRSVTNIEYLAACAKGIPIYVFIDKQVETLFHLWQKHPENSFKGTVDDIALFEFIRTIRSEHKTWTIGFEHAQDIVKALRAQFAHLTMDALDWHRHRKALRNPLIASLKGRAFQVAVERPKAWEYKLLSQVVTDEMQKLAEQRIAYDLGFVVGAGQRIGRANVQWCQDHMQRISTMMRQLEMVFNTQYQIAIGRPGEAGDVDRLIFLGKAIGQIYAEAMDWTQTIRRAHFHKHFAEMKAAMELFTGDIVLQLTEWEKGYREAMTEIDEKIASGEHVKLEFVVNPKFLGLEEYSAATTLAIERFEADDRAGVSPDNWS